MQSRDEARVHGERVHRASFPAQARDEAQARVLVERCERRPSPRDVEGRAAVAAACGFVEEPLEGEREPSPQASALDVGPAGERGFLLVLSARAEIAGPSIDGVAVATRLHVLLEPGDVELEGAGVETHCVVRDVQTLTDVAVELQERLAQRLARLGLGSIAPEQRGQLHAGDRAR